MAEEEVLALEPAASPPPDHKRKLDDWEAEEAPEPVGEADSDYNVHVSASDSLDAKRPRLDEKPEVPGNSVRQWFFNLRLLAMVVFRS